MEPKIKIKVPSQEYYKKIVLGLGDKVYAREELEDRFREIDSEIGYSTSRHASHVTKTLTAIKKLAEDFIVIIKDDAKKSSSEGFYQITKPLEVVKLIMKASKTSSTTDEKKVAKADKEEKPVLATLEGRKLRKIELPEVKVDPTASSWTDDEHELAFFVGGLLKRQGKGLGEGQILRVLRTDCGFATTEEDLRALIQREPNLEFDSRSGVVVRLKKDEKGNTVAAWEQIKKLHDPSKIRKTLIFRTDLSKETIEAALPGCKIGILSDEKMVGTLYHIEISASETDLIRAAMLYARIQDRGAEFMYAVNDDAYMFRIRNAYGRIERSLRATSVRSEIETESWLEKAAMEKRGL